MYRKKQLFQGIYMFGLSLIISGITHLVSSTPFAFVDTLFWIGLLITVIGSVFLVHEQGLMNAPNYFFRKLASLWNSEAREFVKNTSLTDYIRHRPIPLQVTLPLIGAGILDFMVSLIVSLIAY